GMADAVAQSIDWARNCGVTQVIFRELSRLDDAYRSNGPSTIDASMLLPLWLMLIGTKFWFAGSLLTRARRQSAPRGRQGLDRAQRAGGRGMNYLP
ncbi:hypothetical protein ACDH50_20400, partial [Xanthomonas fragariae]